MSKLKWFPVAYLISSVICFILVVGMIAWHYFHEHHGDTRTEGQEKGALGSGVSYALNQINRERLLSENRQTIATGVLAHIDQNDISLRSGE